MPYKILKNQNDTYRLVGSKDKKVYAYETTKAKAKKQIQAIESNKKEKKATAKKKIRGK
jgi:hypothetical protein